MASWGMEARTILEKSRLALFLDHPTIIVPNATATHALYHTAAPFKHSQTSQCYLSPWAVVPLTSQLRHPSPAALFSGWSRVYDRCLRVAIYSWNLLDIPVVVRTTKEPQPPSLGRHLREVDQPLPVQLCREKIISTAGFDGPKSDPSASKLGHLCAVQIHSTTLACTTPASYGPLIAYQLLTPFRPKYPHNKALPAHLHSFRGQDRSCEEQRKTLSTRKLNSTTSRIFLNHNGQDSHVFTTILNYSSGAEISFRGCARVVGDQRQPTGARPPNSLNASSRYHSLKDFGYLTLVEQTVALPTEAALQPRNFTISQLQAML